MSKLKEPAPQLMRGQGNIKLRADGGVTLPPSCLWHVKAFYAAVDDIGVKGVHAKHVTLELVIMEPGLK